MDIKHLTAAATAFGNKLAEAGRTAADEVTEVATKQVAAANKAQLPETAGVAAGHRFSDSVDSFMQMLVDDKGLSPTLAASIRELGNSGVASLTGVVGATAEQLAPRIQNAAARELVDGAASATKSAGVGIAAGRAEDGLEAIAARIVQNID